MRGTSYPSLVSTAEFLGLLAPGDGYDQLTGLLTLPADRRVRACARLDHDLGETCHTRHTSQRRRISAEFRGDRFASGMTSVSGQSSVWRLPIPGNTDRPLYTNS